LPPNVFKGQSLLTDSLFHKDIIVRTCLRCGVNFETTCRISKRCKPCQCVVEVERDRKRFAVKRKR
jgi:hypothetical protein